MSRVLIAHAFFASEHVGQDAAEKPYPPLGPLTIAAAVREGGFEVDFFDATHRSGASDIQELLARDAPNYLVIHNDVFNALTRVRLNTMRNTTNQLIRYGKAQGCKVIVGGYDASREAEKYLSKGADFVLVSGGEYYLKELLYGLDLGMEDFQSIDGLAYVRDGVVRETTPATLYNILDSMPNPAWDLIDVEAYRKVWMERYEQFSINVATTSGCINEDSIQDLRKEPRRLPNRSPQRVVAEIAFLLAYFEPNHIWICDEVFGLHPGWVEEFAAAVRERQLGFSYSVQSRADLLLKSHTLDAFAESGADTIWIGAESGSQSVLDAMERGVTIEQIYQATRMMQERQIKVGFSVQFGFVGETEEDIERTLNMVLELQPDEIGISLAYPVPGTRYHREFKKMLRKSGRNLGNTAFDLLYARLYPKEYCDKLNAKLERLYEVYQGLDQFREQTFIKQGFQNRNGHTPWSTFSFWPTSLIQGCRLKKLESAKRRWK